MGARYYNSVSIDFLISRGWLYYAIYSNLYRRREGIVFNGNYLEESKEMVAVVGAMKGSEQVFPYCAIQLIINYTRKGERYMCVATIVQPLSSEI
jgi:hypothetical protein